MPKKIITYILSALVLASSFSRLHFHVPKHAEEASYVQAATTSSSEPCPLCWAQANFNSDGSGITPVSSLAFAVEIVALGRCASPSSAAAVLLISPRAPPLV
jgi:hypothetical protein